MPELTDQLREEFRTAADDVAPGDGLDTWVRGRVRRRERRRRTARLGGVVAVLALVALVAPRALGGDGPDVLSGPSAPAGEEAGVYLVPDWLPAGFELTHAMEVTLPEGAPQPYGRVPARGRSLAARHVHQAPAGAATTTSVPDPTARAVTVRGHEAWVIDAPRLLSPRRSAPRVTSRWSGRSDPGPGPACWPGGSPRTTCCGSPRACGRCRPTAGTPWSTPSWSRPARRRPTTSAPSPTSTPTTAPTATSTSAPTATTTASPPAGGRTPAPEAGSSSPGATVAGDYAGTEHYTLGTAECPDMDHTFDAVLTASDGTAWSFHEDYCGRIVDDWWSGEGTFTLTGPAATSSRARSPPRRRPSATARPTTSRSPAAPGPTPAPGGRAGPTTTSSASPSAPNGSRARSPVRSRSGERRGVPAPGQRRGSRVMRVQAPT